MDRRKETINLIEECYQKSIELLLNNSTNFGILASAKSSRATGRNYLSIFGRDASICVLGMVASRNKKLISIAKNSLITLARYQASNGQIPNYVKPEIEQTDFWYIGCIDATLWWLIAIKYFDRYCGEKNQLEEKLSSAINRAIIWLLCHEHQKFYLLEQNEASDWADIMPRSGYVLYTNVLWYWVKLLYQLPVAADTKTALNYLFYPWQKIPASFFKDRRRGQTLIKYIRASQKNPIII